MKKLLLGLSVLAALSSYASPLERIKGNSNTVEVLKNSGGIEQRKILNQLYNDNFLDMNKSYVLIQIKGHPGLICATSLNDGRNAYEISGKKDHISLITEYRSEEQSTVAVTLCGTVPYITNDSTRLSPEEAIDSYIKTIVISKDRIYEPEENRGTRIRILPSNALYKVEVLRKD